MSNYQIATTLDSIRGIALIAIVSPHTKQMFELKWRRQPNGDVGFVSNFHTEPIRLTETSAALFIEILVDIVREALGVSGNDDNITVWNDRGERLPEIQFLPPTFVGNTLDIATLVEKQEILKHAYNTFEYGGRRINIELLDACQTEGILEDFLTIIESKLAGIRFNLHDLIKE
jgi:hypothetical protein